MMTKTKRKIGGMGWTLIILALLAVAAFGIWRWALANNSAATLDWIDAQFTRDIAVEKVAAEQYGSDPAQRVELWKPSAELARRPLIVFIHGGGWNSGRPEDYRFVARTFGNMGYPVALVGYRLVPGGEFPAMLEDSAAATEWLAKNAAVNGVDADRMILMGHSAGAYNVLMLGLDPEWLAAAGLSQDRISGVVSLAGPADFYPFTSDSARMAFGNVEPVARTQPISFVRASGPPLLLLTGSSDTVVEPRNSRVLADAIRSAGGRVEKDEFDGMSHAGIIMALSRPFSQDGRVTRPILDFIQSLDTGDASSVPVQGKTR